MAFNLGIDIGSITSKGVITENNKLIAHHVMLSGINYKETSDKLRDELINMANISLDHIKSIGKTGQGADSVDYSNQKFDDIRCCARGIFNIFPDVRTIIDIQGQHTQVIHINEKGNVAEFNISEKCAAGSGRILQIIANILHIDLKEIGEVSMKSKKPVSFTTGCAVFWESEAISRISEGFSKEDIIAGVHEAMANKISSLAEKIGKEEKFAVTGGSAVDTGLVKTLEDKLGVKLLIPQHPQIVPALGAALMAAKANK